VVVENDQRESIIGGCRDGYWKKKMIEFGGDYVIWSNAPENPHYN
jgi:putative transcriptional regulator